MLNPLQVDPALELPLPKSSQVPALPRFLRRQVRSPRSRLHPELEPHRLAMASEAMDRYGISFSPEIASSLPWTRQHNQGIIFRC